MTTTKRKIIFTGGYCSGKSTLAKKLSKQYGFKITDVFDYVRIHHYFIKKGFVTERILKFIYKKFLINLKQKNFNIIEIANDYPKIIIPRLIKILEQKKVPRENIILVFCFASLNTCISRNKKRSKPVPLKFFKKNKHYDGNFYKKLCDKLKINFVKINTEQNFKDSYKLLLDKITN